MNTIIEKVLEQIQKDIADDDMTAIAELLSYLPAERLIGYLPENE